MKSYVLWAIFYAYISSLSITFGIRYTVHPKYFLYDLQNLNSILSLMIISILPSVITFIMFYIVWVYPELVKEMDEQGVDMKDLK